MGVSEYIEYLEEKVEEYQKEIKRLKKC